MVKQKKRTLGYVLLLLFLGYLAYYVMGHYKDFQALLQVNALYLLIIALGHITGIYLNALFIKFILEPFGKSISHGQSFMVALISTIGNYFLPVGTGAGVKAVYLKRKHGLSYTDFMSTLSGNYIIVFLLSSLFGLLALPMLRGQAPVNQLVLIGGVLGGIFLMMTYLAFFGFPNFLVKILGNIKIMSRYLTIISNMLNGWNKITHNRRLTTKLIVLTFMQLVIMAFITFTATSALGFDISLWALMLYTSLAALSLLLNITPGSIGIRETVFVLLGTTLGLSTPEILSISIVEKGTLFFVLIVSWILVKTGLIKTKVTS